MPWGSPSCAAERGIGMYQVKPGFIHRHIGDVDVVISIGENVADFNGYMTLNETASCLWDALTTPKSADQLIALLCDEFDVTAEEARADVDEFLTALLAQGILHEVTL